MLEAITFTKMHGIGNDYVYIDCMCTVPEHLPQLAIEMSDRHTGVGGDGIILILPSAAADIKMRIFNADGSEAAMCGNGIRCVARYAREHGLVATDSFTIEALAGNRNVHINRMTDGSILDISVDMGEYTVGDKVRIGELELTPVNVGNPHAVCFVPSYPDDSLVLDMGPSLETAPVWPERANIEFIQVSGDNELNMRVWERGSGETMACGTGACAAASAAVTLGMADVSRPITVHLRGGDLTVCIDKASRHIRMTGPATEVFTGVYPRRI